MIVTASWLNSSGAPLTSPATLPTITIRRLDTDATVVSAASMSEVGGGAYKYDFTAIDVDLVYVASLDGDPIAAGQVQSGSRYLTAIVDGLALKARRDTTNRMVMNVARTAATVYEEDDTTTSHTYTLTSSPDTRTPD